LIRTNDRPNIHIAVRAMQHPANSFADLKFLIPDDVNEHKPPPKFVIFTDNCVEAEDICKYLHTILPISLRSRIKWFHSRLSGEYRAEISSEFKKGTCIWGLVATDAYGMGVDQSGIEIVVQWKVAHLTSQTALQRAGRAARGLNEQGYFILIVEKKFFDDEREKTERAKTLRRERDQARKRRRE
ncbi:P-loop containing nucleoside triphosphate hydrolase protein, partial [Punctularia strigosozonata HHB-11173 SS5]|uniref:P-loop containing nucleoside triphosphate hydrolase protein n=1 Tax=Punctularia strigosozonata (strain HHB-11173) TaxID=741275 RepID=UPI00044167EE